MKKIIKFLIPIAIVIAGLLIAQGLYSIDKGKVPGALSPEKAAEKTIDFINQVALEGRATASLVDVAEESGLYKIRLKIEEEEYESYVTRDGKILFPQGGTKMSEQPSEQAALKEFPKTDVPQVQLFVMSFCGFGNQAEELMIPVAGLLGDKADIKLHYIIYSNYAKSLRDQGHDALVEDYCLSKEEKYCSMHGIQELNQGVRELCVQKYQKDKFWNFVKEINNTCNYEDVDSCWEDVAKNIGIDVTKIKTCRKNETLDILTRDIELGQKYGISGSPQLIINGVEYEDARTSESYKKAICSAFNSAPEECSQVLSDETNSASGNCE